MSETTKLTFAGAVRIALQKYFDFRGVATRREYWFFILFTALVSLVLGTVDQFIFPQRTEAIEAMSAAMVNQAQAFDFNLMAEVMREDFANSPISNIVGLILGIPTLTAMVRRMRDAGFSAWFLLLAWVPLLTFIFTVLPTKRRLG